MTSHNSNVQVERARKKLLEIDRPQLLQAHTKPLTNTLAAYYFYAIPISLVAATLIGRVTEAPFALLLGILLGPAVMFAWSSNAELNRHKKWQEAVRALKPVDVAYQYCRFISQQEDVELWRDLDIFWRREQRGDNAPKPWLL